MVVALPWWMALGLGFLYLIGVTLVVAVAIGAVVLAIVVTLGLAAAVAAGLALYYSGRALTIALLRGWARLRGNEPRAVPDPVSAWTSSRRQRRAPFVGGDEDAKPHELESVVAAVEPRYVWDGKSGLFVPPETCPVSESEPEPTNLGESEAVTQNSARVEELVSAANTAWAEADVERLRRLAVELDNLRQTGLAAALRRAAVQFERGALPAAHT